MALFGQNLYHHPIAFNDAHIAIAQYKNQRSMWFARVPHVGELVLFAAPQGGVVYFEVEEVQHRPLEAASLPAASSTLQSAIFLRPVLVNKQPSR